MKKKDITFDLSTVLKLCQNWSSIESLRGQAFADNIAESSYLMDGPCGIIGVLFLHLR